MSETVHFVQSRTWASPVLPGFAYLLVGGVEYGPFAIEVSQFQLMQLFVDARAPIHAKYDNYVVGTTGYGSSDVFSSDFSSGPIPPWDDVFLSDGTTTDGVSGGTLNFDNSAVSGSHYYYIEKLLASAYTELYFQFDMKLTAATITANSGQIGIDWNSFIVYSDASYGEWAGFDLWDFATGAWQIYSSGGPISFTSGAAVPVADTWFTVGFRVIAS